MPFRPDRRPRGQDPFLPQKMLLFTVGAGCAFAGMLFDAGWLITIGAVVLGGGVLLRLIGERRRAEAAADDAEQDTDSSPTAEERDPAADTPDR